MIDTSDLVRYCYMAMYSVARLLPGLPWSRPIIYLYALVLVIVVITSVLYMGRPADWTYFVQLNRDHLLLHAFAILVVDPLRIAMMRCILRFIGEVEDVEQDSDFAGNELLDSDEIDASRQASINTSENLGQGESKASEGWKEANAYYAKIEEESNDSTIEPQATSLQKLMKKRDAELKGLTAAERALGRAMQDAMERASKVLSLQDAMDRVESLEPSKKGSKALFKHWMAERRQLRRKVAIGMSNLSLYSGDIADLCSKLKIHQSAVSLLDAEIGAAQQSSERCSTQVDDEPTT